jgi:hypothetical protein
MPLVIPNGFAQVAYRWSLVGDPEVMVSTMGFNFAEISGGDQANLDAITDQFTAIYPANGMFSGYTFLGCRAYVGVGGPSPVVMESPRAIVGTAGGSAPPQNCAILVKKRSAIPGRRGQGRMYIPPFLLSEGAVGNNGVLDTAFLAQVQAGINAWLGSNWATYILHGDEPTTMDPTPITALVVDRSIATQRRRLRR